MILMLAMIQVVSATVIFEISENNITWESVTISKWGGVIDEANNIATVQNLDECNLYYFRSMDDITSWKYTSERTECSGETTMATLSISLFILSITFIVFYLGFKGGFSENKYREFVTKRSLYVLGFFLLVFDAAIFASFATTFGLGISGELYMFMQIFGYAGWIAILILIIGSIFELLRELKGDKKAKRTGGNE